jgi:hypothetical protein
LVLHFGWSMGILGLLDGGKCDGGRGHVAWICC